ncbi:MAG: NAD-dependent epimerase/dehydratase family protein, partial [Gemmatimonadales bacterium]
MTTSVFLTGGTGYIGSRLAERLVARGHAVRALVRPGSERKLPSGVSPVPGNALEASSFAAEVRSAETFVQLVGTPHPSPAKAAEFRSVDLASARASIENAARVRVAHFVYVSVAHPAPAMHAYIAVRTEGEALLRATGLPATILRPWYVLGPGHRWPYALLPAYWVAERIPSLRDGARRLGLVTIDQMLAALVRAVETPADGVRIWGVPEIRAGGAGPGGGG